MSYLLSFCIPEHNESDLVLELVQSLLSNPDPNFQTIVSDNMTDNADPAEVFRDIQDERFRLFQTEVPLSRQENWLRALEQGEGEYLYLVMGRDWLDSAKIGELLSLLRLARENHVDLLIDRKSAKPYRLYYGIEALNRFINRDHPTGLIISRAALQSNERRKEYFVPGFAYPEIFVKRDILAESGVAAMVSSGVRANVATRVSLGKQLSGTDPFNDPYKMNNVYFSPGQLLKVFEYEIEMVLGDSRFHLTKAERAAFFEQKYQKLLQYSVFENKINIQSEEYMLHYGMHREYVPMEHMFRNLMDAALAGLNVGPRLSLFQKIQLIKNVCTTAGKIINGVYSY